MEGEKKISNSKVQPNRLWPRMLLIIPFIFRNEENNHYNWSHQREVRMFAMQYVPFTHSHDSQSKCLHTYFIHHFFIWFFFCVPSKIFAMWKYWTWLQIELVSRTFRIVWNGQHSFDEFTKQKKRENFQFFFLYFWVSTQRVYLNLCSFIHFALFDILFQ